MPTARNGKTASRKRAKEREAGTRKASRHLEGVKRISMTDYDLLRKFMTEHGKIMPARLTGATAKCQRRIRRAIHRARVMGLLP